MVGEFLREGPFQSEELGRTGQSLLNRAGDDRAIALQAMHDGAVAVLRFFGILHKEKLWLSRNTAKEVVACIDLFLSSYVFLAKFSHAKGLTRYHLEPSHHMLAHIITRIEEALARGAPMVLSPAAFLCEMSEDFVGRVSRISRRVHSRTCGKRTCQRYLIKLFLEFERFKV